MGRGGHRPFVIFPKKHPLLRIQTSLMSDTYFPICPICCPESWVTLKYFPSCVFAPFWAGKLNPPKSWHLAIVATATRLGERLWMNIWQQWLTLSVSYRSASRLFLVQPGFYRIHWIGAVRRLFGGHSDWVMNVREAAKKTGNCLIELNFLLFAE